MCSQYWTLRTVVPLPCGHTADDWQTHFMGEGGSCSNYYGLDKPIEELGTWSGSLPGDDWFISQCDACNVWYRLGAQIKRGRVVRVGVPVPA